jgi:hypothetical protein
MGTYCPETDEAPEEGEEEVEAVEGEEEECAEPAAPEGETEDDSSLEPIKVSPAQTTPAATENEVVESAATVAANTKSQVDSVVRPLYDGAMAFAAIRSPDSPETYSWEVTLGAKQQLKQNDSQHAEVYNKNGTAAFSIDARPARDAQGSAVPTNITVEDGNVVTLRIEHRGESPAGGSFVYPVVGGTGWQGGFQTFETYLGEPSPPSAVENGEIETDLTGVKIATFGPPWHNRTRLDRNSTPDRNRRHGS